MYTDFALDRLRQLETQPWVMAEIFEINADELEEVDSANPIEGLIEGNAALMWRRAVRRNDIDSFLSYETHTEDALSDAWNFVTIYRWATDDEIITYELEGDTLLVVSVVSNLELVRYFNI
ncbi:hypothetical protein [Mycolicibacterium sp. 120270]|uniref:hypothetical protein n=1 Tax=Mycolicibacterium sp. 120270 TaxID=3090600 RepID=UPI00299F1454|nr:hypothetical protein [Mycolicibacterium sp. 120270]MDX1883055.1 hypothetical protein [Mycolicibacterium sp. 120270]